jgi:Kef-type K+ transport system membrane component KefB
VNAASSDSDDAHGSAPGEHRAMSSESDRDESDRLGLRFWGGLVAITLAIAAGLVIALLLFGAAWYAWGLLGAAVALVAIVSAVAYLGDRRSRRRWS